MSPILAWASFVLLAVAALLAPLHQGAEPAERGRAAAWPARFEGRALVRLPPAPEDRLLARRFPGHVARFSDGRRHIVLRQVTAPTRRLHPAGDCFRATGHAIGPSPMQMTGGAPSSCFTATRGGRTVRVCEQVRGPDGRSWPDISSWYWPALTGAASGPWLAVLTVETIAAAP